MIVFVAIAVAIMSWNASRSATISRPKEKGEAAEEKRLREQYELPKHKLPNSMRPERN